MRILAIDPGPEKSAYVFWDPDLEAVVDKGMADNALLADSLESVQSQVAIEMLACFGMPVGKEVFQTALWIGQFIRACSKAGSEFCSPRLIYRMDIKMHLCHSPRAKDSNIRQALLDRFGQQGTKKNQGKLYGISKDIWSALAVAVYYADTKQGG